VNLLTRSLTIGVSSKFGRSRRIHLKFDGIPFPESGFAKIEGDIRILVVDVKVADSFTSKKRTHHCTMESREADKTGGSERRDAYSLPHFACPPVSIHI